MAEVLHNPSRTGATTESALRVSSAIWVAIVGAVLGFTLSAWDGFTSSSPRKGLHDGGIGAAIGAGAGFVGGYVAQALYADMLKDVTSYDELKRQLYVARTVGWAIFGLILGLGLGLRGGGRKIVNGLIGGTVGGAVGGLLFQALANASDSSDSGFTLRLVGLTLTGVGIGLGVGLVERIRRDAWLLISGGPMAGKEFILYKPQTIIGADYRSDIVLVKDPQVAPQHLVLERQGANVVVNAEGAIFVNGQPL